MKILLLGANGQLGHQLHADLQSLGQVKAFTRQALDMSAPLEVMAQLHHMAQHFSPNVVINAAAYTCLLYTSPSPRDRTRSRMPSSA